MNLWNSGKRGFTLSIAGLASVTPIAIVAHAEIYLAPEQAAALIFPNSKKLERKEIVIPDEQIAGIEKASGEPIRSKKLVLFTDGEKNAVIVDQVLGKHEMIMYATGIAADGTVRGVEILEYRETYGQNVRLDWRKQFNGKTKASELKAGKDIKILSGATLSSAHLAAGIRRLLQTYDVIRPLL